MAATPKPRSFNQILGDITDAFRSEQGVRAVRVGGGILSAFEAAARSDLRGSQDLFQLLNSIALDKATQLALDRIGADENCPRQQQAPATGTVDVTDTSFTKVSTKLFQGAPAPISGTANISVADGSGFPGTGSIYIGRGTPNYEGPLAYTSVTDVGTHWVIALSTHTTNFHNTSESVVLAQGGDRVVGPGVIAQTPQANVANAVTFSVLYKTKLSDGETQVSGVQVVAQLPGIVGNVIAGAIKEFASAPFSGAAVTNPTPFSNGIETELDDAYRERIRAVRKSRQTGTSLAIRTSVIGVTSPDENKRIASASIVKRQGQASTLYIDDGTGYEESTAGVAIETLVDSAIGGEQFLEAAQRPIARAFAISQNQAPFPLIAGSVLTVKVGGVSYTHNFSVDAFTSIGNASAFEVVSSVNSDPTLAFLARTANGGTDVVIFAKNDTNEDIEIVASEGVDANVVLGFPLGVNYTVQLYKNDRLLTKDGISAKLAGQPFSAWNAMTGAQTLVLGIDGTPALTFTFTDQSFIDAQTGFATLGRNSIAAWIAVIDAAVPGISATEDSGRIVLTSNAGASAKSAVQILDGTLVTNRLFTLGSAQGAAPDYTLDRNASQITLVDALLPGDKLTLGSLSTRAFLESEVISPTTLSSVAKLWFVVDGDAQIISTGISTALTLTISVNALHDWGHTLKLLASAGTPFANVSAGDWLILWDPALDASLQGAFRIVSVTAGNAIVIERRLGQTLRMGHRSVAFAGSGATIGKVFTTGGATSPTNDTTTAPVGATDTCEFYDPNTSLSSVAAPMSFARAFHTATVLQDGRVLVAGGMDDTGTRLTSIEIYNPGSNTWTTSAAVLPAAVTRHQATLLGNGTVLITGGKAVSAVQNWAVYDPGSDSITATGNLTTPRFSHKQVLLPNGNVFIVGGNAGGDVATTEIWNSSTLTSTASTPMARPRASFGLALVGTSPTTVLAAGGTKGVTGNSTYEIYTIGTALWGAETTLPATMNFEDTDLVTLPNGHVVGLCANSSDHSTSFGFQYDGATFTSIAADPFMVETSGRWLSQVVPIANGSGTIKNRIVVIGGAIQLSTAWGIEPTATIEQYDNTGNSWLLPDPALGTATLNGAGGTVVRTAGLVREVDVPVATNYTASTFAAVVNADASNPGLAGLGLSSPLKGATATIYQTSKVRITTNTHAKYGNIALVAQNPAASGFGLTPGSAADNLTDHVGSVESKSELGAPAFNNFDVRANTTNGSLIVGIPFVDVAYSLVGLHNWWRGAAAGSPYTQAFFYPRAGSNQGFRTRLTGTQAYTDLSRIDLRDAPIEPWAPLDRAYLAAPFALGPNDDLTVTADNDVTKRFSIKMWRTLAPVGNTYLQTNTFTDADASTGLQNTFGSTYDFNDFTVYMNARAVAFSGDANKALLFRFYRLGPEGDTARVRFGNPVAPNAPLSVTSTMAADKTDVTVVLASGGLRAPTVHNTTNLGVSVTAKSSGGTATIMQVLNLLIASASRTSNVDTLTLTMPAGVTDHGFQIGNVVWVQSTNADFSSGQKTLTGRTATTISYAETAADAGPDTNIGDVSYDSFGEATFAGSSTAVNDWFRLNGGSSAFNNRSFQISAVDAGGGNVTTHSGDQLDGSLLSVNTILSWLPVSVFTNLQVITNTPQTCTAVVAAINALAAAANSTCPITAKVLTGGTGTIATNTPDFLDNSVGWYSLADGVNWVATTTLPGSNYQLTFKKPINGALSANADWQDEVVRIVPSTAKNVVDWLNTPTITGLFTACSVQASDDGTKVQIASLTPGAAGGVQVQGGLANTVVAPLVGTMRALTAKAASTVKTADAVGMAKGFWCRVDNAGPLPITNNFGAGLSLVSWNAAGLIQFSAPIAGPVIFPVQAKVRIERQGDFVFVSDMGADTNAGFSAAQAGCWVRIAPAASPTGGYPQVSSPNRGIYRILRTVNTETGASGGFYIENDNSLDEIAECEISAFTTNAVMPGDTFVLSTPIWGAANQGTWTVKAVGETSAGSGDQFAHYDRFTVDTSSRTPVPQGTGPALTSTTAALAYLIENSPTSYILKIDGIAPNQVDGTFTDIRWDMLPIYSAMGAGAGSIIKVLDKLSFPTAFAAGTDGYAYSTGLIGEANRVVYGDPSDTATYPGQASDGANINIQGPLVKRVAVSLLLRVRSGVSNDGVADRVRSAVATVINSTGIGQPIALSAIVAAASKVVGVVSVVIVSPAYGTGNDSHPRSTV